MRGMIFSLLAAMAVAGIARGEDAVGVVSHIKITSSAQKGRDVSSLEDWKRTFIKEGMSEKDKAMAVFETNVMYQQADSPPNEFLQRENAVLDPIKLFNVYGYTLCSVSAADMACLARVAGLKARNCTVNNHTIPELYFDGAWHMMDADLIEYFPKADGTIASVPEMVEGIQEWLKQHSDFPVGLEKKQARYKWMNGKGWKENGPEVLKRCPFYDENGWLPCAEFAWGDTMHQFGKIQNTWESCYSMGYEVNVQLHRGERLTRNWFNKGLHVNMDGGGGKPASLTAVVGKGSLKHSPKWGDVAPGRVGSGLVEYEVPLRNFEGKPVVAENVAGERGVHVKDAEKAGVLEFRRASSYVYLGGKVEFTAKVGEGGEVKVLLSVNNGLDWQEVATVTEGGEKTVDLKVLVLRKYAYHVRFVMKGKGTGLETLKFVNEVQCSQRALPALVLGENKIRYSAGAAEGTVTVEGAMDLPAKDAGKALTWGDFHPVVEGFTLNKMPTGEKGGSVAFPVKAYGEITRVRASDYFLSQSETGVFLMEVSFDGGKTWKEFDRPGKEELWAPGRKYVARYAKAEAPAGMREAMVRYVSTGGATLCNARVDVDYKEPAGGVAPVQVTYVWEEGGVEKKDVHVVKGGEEEWGIKCESTPVMKSIILEVK